MPEKHDQDQYGAYYTSLVDERIGLALRNASFFVIGLNTFFLLLDAWVYPDRFQVFLALRIAWNVAMVGSILARPYLNPLLYVRATCLLIGLALISLSGAAGGVSSVYWPALMVLFLGMPVMVPLTASMAAGIVVVLSAVFAALPLATGEAVELRTYAVPVFFVVSAAIECVASAVILDRMRYADFLGRIEIEEARDHLQELDRAKSRFTANIHHELRTPLTLILAPLAALRGGDYGAIPDHVLSTLKTMDVNGRRLHKLINNLLDLAKLESKQFGIHRQPMSLRELAEDVVAGAVPLAERKGIALSVEGFEDLPPLNADADALDKVLVNLIGNALKFTEADGTIAVWAGPRTGGEEPGIRLEVRDTGIGIPTDQVGKIFDRFAQVDGSTTRKHEGTGIGLSLTQELVELHGGRIWAESEGLGCGSTMVVELPSGESDGDLEEDVLRDAEGGGVGLADSMAAAEAELNLEDDGEGAPGPKTVEMQRSVERWELATQGEIVTGEPSPHAESVPEILIAEDNPDMRKLLAFLLAREFRVRVTRNGREALEAIRERHPYLVLTDVMMPEMSGTELCAAVKGDPETRHIPVVLVTSKAEREMKIEGLELGADDYVTKPFHPRELMARVRSLVRIRDLQEAVTEQNASLSRAVAELKQTQVKLVQNERLAAVGELAAGIAHEVNNPVNFALNASRTLRASVGEMGELAQRLAEVDWRDEAKLREQLEALQSLQAELGIEEVAATLTELADIVEEGLGRTASLVGDLRDFASPGRVGGVQVEARVSLRRGLISTLQLLRHSLNELGADVSVQVPEDLPDVPGDSGALNQVFLNLLKNAAEASPGGGVTIHVEGATEGTVDGTSDGCVRLSFHDNGPGIAPEVIDQLFEPFFTTKQAGQGTGLGLSISRQIVESHGGSLQVESVLGEGTTFTMRVPIQGTSQQGSEVAT